MSGIVKPLEWIECSDGTWHDAKCQYEIELSGKFWRVTKGVTGGGRYVCDAPSLEAAKAAAQADYEDRVLSALTADPKALAAAALERAVVVAEKRRRMIKHVSPAAALALLDALPDAIRALIDTDHAAALEAVKAKTRAEERKACATPTPAEAARVLLDADGVLDKITLMILGKKTEHTPNLDYVAQRVMKKSDWCKQVEAALRAIADGGDDE